MSSPLSFFRRNQKLMLAVFGVLIMLTFVVGDYVSRYQSGRSGTGVAEESVVTWKHGKLFERDLWAMREAHNLAVHFLDLLVQKTIEAKGQPKGLGVTVISGRVIDPGIPRSYAEEDLVQTMILAKKAEDLGVRISDDAIFEFLGTLSDDVIPRSQFGVLLGEATHGRFGKSQLFEQLRTELLAQHMRMMAGSGLFAMSPGLAWDAYNRMNRRVKTELLPLDVNDFTNQVTAQPTEAEIEALYSEGKSALRGTRSSGRGIQTPPEDRLSISESGFREVPAKGNGLDYATTDRGVLRKKQNRLQGDRRGETGRGRKPGEAKPGEAKPEPAGQTGRGEAGGSEAGGSRAS